MGAAAGHSGRILSGSALGVAPVSSPRLLLEERMRQSNLILVGIPVIPPSSIRCRREVLTAEDLDALHTICAPIAIEFNYRMP